MPPPVPGDSFAGPFPGQAGEWLVKLRSWARFSVDHHHQPCLELHPGLDPGQCPFRLLAARAQFNRRLLRSMINDGHSEGNRMV
jgi:hypothetical protein